MKEEAKKREPNEETVETLMDLTLYDRRNAVLVDKEPPSVIIGQYPWLNKDDGVRRNFSHYPSII